MSSFFKKYSLLTLAAIILLSVPTLAQAEIQCPNDWVKQTHGVAEVCVPKNQNHGQTQNGNHNVSQSVTVTGGSSSSSSSSTATVAINNQAVVPQVVYQAQARITELPRTGLPEAGLALSALLPAGFALKKYAFKKSDKKSGDNAAAIWLEKNS
jgi:hypothetical protein